MSSTSDYKNVLKMGYVIASARSDAYDLGKDIEFRNKVVSVLPLFKQTGKFGPIQRAIREVLGENWQPSGEFKKAIEALSE